MSHENKRQRSKFLRNRIMM